MEFLDSLPKKDRAKLLATIANVEVQGVMITARQQWIKKIVPSIFEIRSKKGNNSQRVCYFHSHEGTFMITHGFTKKSNKAPREEIVLANRIRQHYLNKEGGKHNDDWY